MSVLFTVLLISSMTMTTEAIPLWFGHKLFKPQPDAATEQQQQQHQEIAQNSLLQNDVGK